MSAFRKIVSQNAFHMKSFARNGMRTPVIRNMSSLLDSKEKGEEARYIRKQEELRAAEIRKNLERIMAQDDTSAEKAQLIGILEPKKEPSGIIEKFHLDKWQMWVPLGSLLLFPAVEAQFLMVDADLIISGCFFLFCGTVYTQFGGMIDNFFKEQAMEEEKQMRAADDTILAEIQSGIDANLATLEVREDLTSLFNIKHDIKVVEADVLTAMEQHKYRDAIIAKLESLAVLEDAAEREIRAKMISKVNADVLNTFKNDKKAKENALNQAIAVLSGGKDAKYGKDVVGEVFTQSLQAYKDNYSKQPEDSDPILKKLQQEISAVAQPPVIETKGGNVYTVDASSAKAAH